MQLYAETKKQAPAERSLEQDLSVHRYVESIEVDAIPVNSELNRNSRRFDVHTPPMLSRSGQIKEEATGSERPPPDVIRMNSSIVRWPRKDRLAYASLCYAGQMEGHSLIAFACAKMIV